MIVLQQLVRSNGKAFYPFACCMKYGVTDCAYDPRDANHAEVFIYLDLGEYGRL